MAKPRYINRNISKVVVQIADMAEALPRLFDVPEPHRQMEPVKNMRHGLPCCIEHDALQLDVILTGIRETSVVIENIARDSKEQASSIEEVNVAVRLMDEMTQHNAALVEQTNAAIEQTESQAGDLDRIVGIFVLEDCPFDAKAAMAEAPRNSIGGLQNKVKQAAKADIRVGNAAVKQDWSEH